MLLLLIIYSKYSKDSRYKYDNGDARVVGEVGDGSRINLFTWENIKHNSRHLFSPGCASERVGHENTYVCCYSLGINDLRLAWQNFSWISYRWQDTSQ